MMNETSRGGADRYRLTVRVVTATVVVVVLAATFARGTRAGSTDRRAVPAATAPGPVTVPPRVATHTVVLTSGSDGHSGAYAVSAYGRQMTVSAGTDAPNDNQRTAVVIDGTRPTVDQTRCVRWDYEHRWGLQEGVVLRLRAIGGGAYSAISVTKNIWGQAVWAFNVHEWNGIGAEAGPSNFHRLASFDMADAVKEGLGTRGSQTKPWSLCARATGARLEIKVWTGDRAEPSWTDRVHTRSTTVPARLTGPGVPAVFVGHLAPGDVVHYSAVWNPSGIDGDARTDNGT